MRVSLRAMVLSAWAVAGGACSSAPEPRAATPAASEEVSGDEVAATPGAIRFEPEVVSCAPDRVARPSMPSGSCTEGVSTYVATHRRVRERLEELAASCDAEGELVLQFALRPDGAVEDAEVVESAVDEGTARHALALLRSVAHCPPDDGARTVVTVPLLLRAPRPTR